MGWTFTNATHYKANGTVDRKAECNALFNCENVSKQVKYSVLKSVMVGTVYYAAVEITSPGRREVFAAIVLTASNKAQGYDFGYKDMDETEGPCESKCPNSILDLLTPTTSEFAQAWRQRCREHNAMKQSVIPLAKLPNGSKITFVCNGQEILLVKCPAAYQFKTPFWYAPATNQYCPTKYIPADYTVVYIPSAQQGVSNN